MKTNQIIKLARIKLLELTDDIITAESIFLYLNLSYQDLQKKVKTDNTLKTVSIPISSGEGDLPDDFGTFYGKPIDDKDRVITLLEYQDFIRASKDDLVASKIGSKVKVRINSGIGSLSVVYYPTFETLTAGIDPETDEYFDEVMVYGIMYRALQDLQDQELSNYYKGIYDSMVEEKASVQSSYEENAQEGQMFTHINII